MTMKRMIPAMILTAVAGMAGGFGPGGSAPGMKAPAPAAQPGSIPSNSKADRVLRAMMGGGRRGRKGSVIAGSINGRPDTGVARIKRAARKARNQRRNKRAHRRAV